MYEKRQEPSWKRRDTAASFCYLNHSRLLSFTLMQLSLLFAPWSPSRHLRELRLRSSRYLTSVLRAYSLLPSGVSILLALGFCAQASRQGCFNVRHHESKLNISLSIDQFSMHFSLTFAMHHVGSHSIRTFATPAKNDEFFR